MTTNICVWYCYDSDIWMDYPKLISEKWNLTAKFNCLDGHYLMCHLHYVSLCVLGARYCIRGYFRGGFILANFASQTLQKFPLQYMPIYSNENIRKIVKLSPCKFPHLVQNSENICTRKLWRIHVLYPTYLVPQKGFKAIGPLVACL